MAQVDWALQSFKNIWTSLTMIQPINRTQTCSHVGSEWLFPFFFLLHMGLGRHAPTDTHQIPNVLDQDARKEPITLMKMDESKIPNDSTMPKFFDIINSLILIWT